MLLWAACAALSAISFPVANIKVGFNPLQFDVLSFA